jgi:NAD(P)-dependent dehydrogenase (short-subunit alcohol dehydrogenase family)
MIFAGVVISYYLGRQIEREERKKDLNKDSVVVISGACTGIGLMLAIKIATEHQCHIVIYDSAKNNPEGLSNGFFTKIT